MSTELHPLTIKEILKRVGEVIGDHKTEEIAKALGVSPTTASNWKTRNTIPWDELWRFCNEHHIPLARILTGNELQKSGRSTREGAGGGEKREAEFLVEKYEKIIKHYVNLIEQQARQIEFMQQAFKSGQRAGDPADLDPAKLRKTKPF
jgi:hypothetical protein